MVFISADNIVDHPSLQFVYLSKANMLEIIFRTRKKVKIITFKETGFPIKGYLDIQRVGLGPLENLGLYPVIKISLIADFIEFFWHRVNHLYKYNMFCLFN